MSLLLRCTIFLLVAQTSQAYTSRGRCETVPDFCRNLTNGDSYTLMRLPNAFNNYHLNETIEAINPWQRLVGKCHAGLKLFLCAIYAPICLHDKETGLKVTIKLCRSFCLKVRASCEPVMVKYHYPWPGHPAFNCSGYVDDLMCVREDFVKSTLAPPTTSGISDYIVLAFATYFVVIVLRWRVDKKISIRGALILKIDHVNYAPKVITHQRLQSFFQYFFGFQRNASSTAQCCFSHVFFTQKTTPVVKV